MGSARATPQVSSSGLSRGPITPRALVSVEAGIAGVETQKIVGSLLGRSVEHHVNL